MKTLLTFAAFLSCILSTNAQSYKSDITGLLENARSNFNAITGQKKSQNDGIITYTCTAPNVFGEVGDILVDTKTNKTVYSMRVNYGPETSKIVEQLTELIDEKFPEPDYVVFYDIDGNDNEDIAVFSGNILPSDQRKQYLSYYIDVNPDTRSKVFELVIYGFSAN